MGTLAIACVCIWNGSFNSIQLILCVLQTVVTMVVLDTLGETENQTVADLRAVRVGDGSGGKSFGEVVDLVAEDAAVVSLRDEGITITTTLGDLLDLAGREETKERIEKKAQEALYEPAYAFTRENILQNWLHLVLFIGVFALLSTVTLEFIDKDKR